MYYIYCLNTDIIIVFCGSVVAPFEFADFVNCMHFDTFVGNVRQSLRNFNSVQNVTTVMFSQGAKTNTEIPLKCLPLQLFVNAQDGQIHPSPEKKAGLKRVCRTSLKSSFSAETTRK